MNLVFRALRLLNSTPSVFLRPTRVSAVDVALNTTNLAFWSWIARRSKVLAGWYQPEINLPGDRYCGHENIIPTLRRNGVAIIPNFLDPEALSAVRQATNHDSLRQSSPRHYGTGVFAHYSQLTPGLVEHFDACIRKIFISLWGFPYNGSISASIQHLWLPADHSDENDANTILHIDRFIPVVKIFYYPYAVKDDEAPFGYVPGSHQIIDRYTDAVRKSFRTLHGERNKPFELPSYSGEEEWRLSVPANSLVVAATHGLHRRIPFSGSNSLERSRTSIRFIFYNQVTKTRLLKSAVQG